MLVATDGIVAAEEADPPNLKPPKGLLVPALAEGTADAAGFAAEDLSPLAASLFSLSGFDTPNENPAVRPPVTGAAAGVEADGVVEREGVAAVRGLAGGFPKAKVVGGGFEAGVVEALLLVKLLFVPLKPLNPPKGLELTGAPLVAGGVSFFVARLPKEKPDEAGAAENDGPVEVAA